jgi:serine/arginine repetitive matrix protein 2
VGTIEAVSTPAATNPTHRFSLAADIHRGRSFDSARASIAAVATAGDREHSTLPPLLVISNYQSGGTSLLPSALPSSTTEVTRSSYTTNDTGTSRISGLSDFPVPPTQTSVPSDREVHSRPVPRKDSSPSAASSLPRPSLEDPSQLIAREPRVGEPDAS